LRNSYTQLYIENARLLKEKEELERLRSEDAICREYLSRVIAENEELKGKLVEEVV